MSATNVIPAISVTRVHPTTVDEWYGVDIFFDWVGFSLKAYMSQANGDWREEERLKKQLTREVAALGVASEKYTTFFSKPCKVKHEEYEDGPIITSVIPKFRADDFEDWTFHQEGGHISATIRG